MKVQVTIAEFNKKTNRKYASEGNAIIKYLVDIGFAKAVGLGAKAEKQKGIAPTIYEMDECYLSIPEKVIPSETEEVERESETA